MSLATFPGKQRLGSVSYKKEKAFNLQLNVDALMHNEK